MGTCAPDGERVTWYGITQLLVVAAMKQREFLGFVDVDEFVDELVVGLIVLQEYVHSLYRFLVEVDSGHDRDSRSGRP